MIFFVCCKAFLKEGKIENFKVIIDGQSISLKKCIPYLPFNNNRRFKSIHLHCTTIKRTFEEKERIKIGFLQYKNRLFFSILLKDNQIIINPIFIKKEVFPEFFTIEIFCNGKKREKINYKLNIDDNKELDFYPVIDKIFPKFNQFDTVFNKKLYVSFKRRIE